MSVLCIQRPSIFSWQEAKPWHISIHTSVWLATCVDEGPASLSIYLTEILTHTSSGQQHAWMRVHHPLAFIRLKSWLTHPVASNMHGWMRVQCPFTFSWQKVKILTHTSSGRCGWGSSVLSHFPDRRLKSWHTHQQHAWMRVQHPLAFTWQKDKILTHTSSGQQHAWMRVQRPFTFSWQKVNSLPTIRNSLKKQKACTKV